MTQCSDRTEDRRTAGDGDVMVNHPATVERIASEARSDRRRRGQPLIWPSRLSDTIMSSGVGHFPSLDVSPRTFSPRFHHFNVKELANPIPNLTLTLTLAPSWHYSLCLRKRRAVEPSTITSSTVNRFWKFFHCCKQQ